MDISMVYVADGIVWETFKRQMGWSLLSYIAAYLAVTGSWLDADRSTLLHSGRSFQVC